MTKVKSYRINVDEYAKEGDAIVIGTCGGMTSQHLGTAASFDIGCQPGNVPVIDSCGKLPDSTIPSGAMKKSVYDPKNKNTDVFDYCNLDNTPEIPVVNDPTVTFVQGGVTVGSISLNQSGNTTIGLMAGGVTAGDGININCNEVSVKYDSCSLGIDSCNKLNVKDYDTIASGAAAGATAVQPGSLCSVATTGQYCDLSGQPTIPTDNCQLANSCNYITNAVNDLQNYYLKCETYQKCEVDNLIANFGGFEVVSTLPTTNIKTNVIYLLGPIGTGADKYEEWIYYNNTWTKIGETTTDLSNYAKCCDIPTDNCQLANSCGYTTCTGTLVPDDLNPYTKTCDLASVSLSGQYCDLSGTPNLCNIATSGLYCDISGTPNLCSVATSGQYCDLIGTPSIPVALSAGNGISITSNCINVEYDNSTIKKNNGNCIYADLTGYTLSCDLSDVATSGCYCDLSGTPDLSGYQTTSNMVCTLSNADNCHYPTAKAVADALSCAGVGDMLSAIYDPNNKCGDAFDYCNFINTPNLCSVATSGAYCDLTGVPDLSCKQDVLTLGTNLHYDSNGCLQVGDANNDLQGMRYVCASYLKTSSGSMTGTPTAIPVLDANGWICKQTPECFISNLGFKTVATSGCYCDLTGIPVIPTDNCQLANSCGYTTCTGTLTDSSLKTVNGCSLVGSGDICIQSGTWGQINGTLCNQTDLNTALSGKLDKVTDTNTYGRVYGISTTGEQVTVCISPGLVNNTLVRRSGNQIIVPDTPTATCHAASKKYVDTAIASAGGGDMCYADYNWDSKSGASVTLSLNSTITPSANFTVNKPSTIKEGQAYVLRVTSGATPYTMTLGTGITNPFGESLALTANGIDQFVFLATSNSALELQKSSAGDTCFVTQAEYEALLPGAASDGKTYFIYEE